MLSLAGIDEDTDIDGIDSDAHGQPTGELQEFAAMFPVYRVIGNALSIAASEKTEAIWNFGRVAQLAGVTTATDLVNDFPQLGNRNLREVTGGPALSRADRPGVRPAEKPGERRRKVLSAMRDSTDKLRFGPVKFIVDGSIQGFTARLKWPGYFNGAAERLVAHPAEPVGGGIRRRFTAPALQLHIHTNGDEATEARARRAREDRSTRHPRRDHRHTLQHCQMADAAQFARAAQARHVHQLFLQPSSTTGAMRTTRRPWAPIARTG